MGLMNRRNNTEDWLRSYNSWGSSKYGLRPAPTVEAPVEPVNASRETKVAQTDQLASEPTHKTNAHPEWPEPLASQALHGTAGVFVRTVEPHTEADPVAILSQFLVAFGNAIGSRAHWLVESGRHGLNLFMCLVGETAKGRKGTSWGHVRRVFKACETQWSEDCISDGLSSGEGVIWAVRDQVEKLEPVKEKGRITDYEAAVSDQGVSDKRLLIIEGEMARVLKVLGRDGNTLSAVIRNAWDTGNLQILTKNSPVQASGAHISIIGHITKNELLRYLDNTETANGFANRFLWLCVRRARILPDGGQLTSENLEPIISAVIDAVQFARNVTAIRRDDEARAIWHNVYPRLSEAKPGLLGGVIARAEAQVMRMACLYALLDCSSVVRQAHLVAALALWEYSEASARYIFGNSLGDPTADRIWKELIDKPRGLKRTDIRDLFGRNLGAHKISQALSYLEACGLARREKEPTGHRPIERWIIINDTT